MLDFFYSNPIGQFLMTVGVSMVPVLELRGGIPFGVALGMPIREAVIAAILGNFIPVPFILLFIRSIFHWMKKRGGKFAHLVERLEARAHLKGRMVQKYSAIGLCILVAIPLPGTGAWTGALVAAILDMQLRRALPSIFLGVIIAAVIVTIITYGVTALV